MVLRVDARRPAPVNAFAKAIISVRASDVLSVFFQLKHSCMSVCGSLFLKKVHRDKRHAVGVLECLKEK